MKITICGSVEFSPKIIELKAELERIGHQVSIPFFTQKIINGEISYDAFMQAKERQGGDILMRKPENVDMIKRYWDLIKDSGAILVVNMPKKGIENYIGGSTLMEMGFAYGHGKTIYLYNPVPEKSERIHYLDEILDLKPIVINGDLGKIGYP